MSPAATSSPSFTCTLLIVLARGTNILAVPVFGVRYPIAVSFRAYEANSTKSTIAIADATTSQLKADNAAGWRAATVPH